MRNDGLVEQLHSAETIIQDYKVKQNIAGDSWTVYRAVSPNSPYDIYLTGLNTTSTFKKRWKATYQIDGGIKIPNAFCIWHTLIDGTNPFIDGAGNQVGILAGFNWADSEAYDPLSVYVMVAAGYNWDATTNTHIGIRFRCISPYKGKIIFEEVV